MRVPPTEVHVEHDVGEEDVLQLAAAVALNVLVLLLVPVSAQNILVWRGGRGGGGD